MTIVSDQDGSVRTAERSIRSICSRSSSRPKAKHEWDLYKLVATTPADEAWRPLAEDGCPLVKA